MIDDYDFDKVICSILQRFSFALSCNSIWLLVHI